MTRTVRQILTIARDLGIEIPESPEGGFKLRRAYAIQCGYPDGWSWFIQNAFGSEWLVSQWGARDLIEFHRDGCVFRDGVELVVDTARRKVPVVHYGPRAPTRCSKGSIDGDAMTTDLDEVDCRCCMKPVRLARRAKARATERERHQKEWWLGLDEDQRNVVRRQWGGVAPYDRI